MPAPFRRYGPKGSQFVRQWKLILLLRQEWLTLDAIAEQQGCTARTVRRDIDVLREAGVPIHVIHNEDEGGWSTKAIWRVGKMEAWPRRAALPIAELSA